MNTRELLDTCTVNLCRNKDDGTYRVELLHTVNGSMFAYSATGPSMPLALDKFAELHNAMVNRALGFGLCVWAGNNEGEGFTALERAHIPRRHG